MPTLKSDFNVYPSLLDAWRGYTHSDEVWETYWGFSENPPHSPEQFHTLQLENFIDSLNHIDGVPSEPASKGTAFNELVDSLVERRKPTFPVEKIRDDDGNVTHLKASLDGFEFSFPLAIIRQMADEYDGALAQYLCNGDINTRFGGVHLYGYIDELMPFCIHDIKTTGRYEFPKFKHSAQRLVYPYCCIQEGMDVRRFDFDIVVLPKKYGEIERFTESYVFDPESDTFTLRSWIEEMLDFVTAHPSLFTNPKFFNQGERTTGTPIIERDPLGWDENSVKIYNNIYDTHKELQ